MSQRINYSDLIPNLEKFPFQPGKDFSLKQMPNGWWQWEGLKESPADGLYSKESWDLAACAIADCIYTLFSQIEDLSHPEAIARVYGLGLPIIYLTQI